MKPAGRRIFAVGAVLAIAAFFLLAPPLIGKWLVVADPLEHAGAVVVFGGQVPFRAMEAADIYKSGMAAAVWLTKGAASAESLAMSRLGIDVTPEYAYSKMVLERLGVPESAIRVLPERVVNTEQEVRCIAQNASASGVDRVILITSKSHTRRVRIMWHSLTSGKIRASVRYAQGDPFNPRQWWRRTSDAMTVARELAGIGNAWAGFPMKSE